MICGNGDRNRLEKLCFVDATVYLSGRSNLDEEFK